RRQLRARRPARAGRAPRSPNPGRRRSGRPAPRRRSRRVRSLRRHAERLRGGLLELERAAVGPGGREALVAELAPRPRDGLLVEALLRGLQHGPGLLEDRLARREQPRRPGRVALDEIELPETREAVAGDLGVA